MLQQIFYFVLSTAFLVVYIFTMIGWVMLRRSVVSIYENGVGYGKFSARWDELRSVRASGKTGISLNTDNGASVTIPETVADFPHIAAVIRSHLFTEP